MVGSPNAVWAERNTLREGRSAIAVRNGSEAIAATNATTTIAASRRSVVLHPHHRRATSVAGMNNGDDNAPQIVSLVIALAGAPGDVLAATAWVIE